VQMVTCTRTGLIVYQDYPPNRFTPIAIEWCNAADGGSVLNSHRCLPWAL